ncbi:hypothetical protein HETIRDRAFT_37752, partial [Heterobasidion irregulare TC 32-1]
MDAHWLGNHLTGIVLCAGATVLLVHYSRKIWLLNKAAPASEKSNNNENELAVSFVFPNFDPCKESVENIKPVPYRPFRWGTYHVTMGIRNISWDSWIEMDNQFADYHRLRAHRMKKRGERVVQTLPESPNVPTSGFDAARELVHELAEYLSRRYPQTFRVERHSPEKKPGSGWYGEAPIRTITILPPINATYNLDEEDPMTVAGLLVQDDLALMIKGNDDVYYMRSGAICTAGFWRLEDKIGLSLDDIHYHGNVPQYEQKLKTSLNRFLQRLPVDKLIQRNNYFFKIVADPAHPHEPLDPHELGWAESTVGDEDAFEPGSGLGLLNELPPSLSSDVAYEQSESTVKPSMMRLRMERQTLRRLPKTGAIIFTIRTYVVPVEELVKEVGVPGRMASAIRSWPDDVAGYKSRSSYAHHVLPYFDECHRRQVEEGLLKADDQPQTDYPF